jgi:hypothetical protein
MKRTITAVAKNNGRKVTIKATYEIDTVATLMNRDEVERKVDQLRDQIYKLMNEELPFHNSHIVIK